MTVIAELRTPAGVFELGRALHVGRKESVVLEKIVSLGEWTVPFIWVYDREQSSFHDRVQDCSVIRNCTQMQSRDEKVLYALDWQSSDEIMFAGIQAASGQLQIASGQSDMWTFELSFPSHENLSTFREFCESEGIPLDSVRIYNPTPDVGPYFGLTEPQRETLSRAVREGYYAIPRERSTKDIAEDLDISDQAVTERLRRAIITLVEHTLIAAENTSEEVVRKAN